MPINGAKARSRLISLVLSDATPHSGPRFPLGVSHATETAAVSSDKSTSREKLPMPAVCSLGNDHRLRIGILFRAIRTTDSAVTISSGKVLQRGLNGTRVATHFCRDRKAWSRARESKCTFGITTIIDRNRITVVVLQGDGAAMDPIPSTAANVLFVAHWSPFRPSSPRRSSTA